MIKIENANFEIFDFKRKVLTDEEVGNLFHRHTKKEYYDDILQYMTSGPVAIIVLINKEETFIDTNGIKTFYASPIERWKETIGLKEPKEAKTNNATSLRAIYATDIIHNEFWGSDSPSDAYRELSIFAFPLPARPPAFEWNPNKLSYHTLMNFLFPVKPNHPDVRWQIGHIQSLWTRL